MKEELLEDIKRHIDYTNAMNQKSMRDLQLENLFNYYNELQQRIDKAIDYIKNNIAEEHYAIDFGLGTSRKWFNGNYLKIIEYLEVKDE